MKDFLKVLASAHFKYLIQHLTNMSPKSLSKLGFMIPQDVSCNLRAKLKYLEKMARRKVFYKYPTDGIVVKTNSRKYN